MNCHLVSLVGHGLFRNIVITSAAFFASCSVKTIGKVFPHSLHKSIILSVEKAAQPGGQAGRSLSLPPLTFALPQALNKCCLPPPDSPKPLSGAPRAIWHGRTSDAQDAPTQLSGS